MKKTKRIIALFMTFTMLLFASACGKTDDDEKTTKEEAVTTTENASSEEVNTEDAATSEEATEAPSNSYKPTKDRSGADITIPENVETIAVFAPSMVETLINLGCAEKIIAIDTQSEMYGYSELKEGLPAFDMMTPDNEQIAALTPDIVFVSGMADIGGNDPYADLKKLGVCVANIPSSDSIQGVKDDIAFIAACVGKEKEGEAIISEMSDKIDAIAKIGETITDKKTVYFEIAAAPYAYSFGKNTFLNEMLEIIGAENIFAGEDGWLSVELESVVAANPDVILTNVNYIEAPVDEILSREGFDAVNAVANKEVYYIDTNSSTLPNENIVKALDEMAKVIYPEFYEQ